MEKIIEMVDPVATPERADDDRKKDEKNRQCSQKWPAKDTRNASGQVPIQSSQGR